MKDVRENPQIHPQFSAPRRASHLRRILIACVVLVLASLNLPNAFSQAVYGTIFGTVTDPTGAVIPNASITVTDISKNVSVTATTNGSGDYQVQHLIPDVYRVQATATGFNAGTVEHVQVFADTQPKVNIQLSCWSCEQHGSRHFCGAIADHRTRRRQYHSEFAGHGESAQPEPQFHFV